MCTLPRIYYAACYPPQQKTDDPETQPISALNICVCVHWTCTINKMYVLYFFSWNGKHTHTHIRWWIIEGVLGSEMAKGLKIYTVKGKRNEGSRHHHRKKQHAIFCIVVPPFAIFHIIPKFPLEFTYLSVM